MSLTLTEDFYFLSSIFGRPARGRELGTSMGRVWDMIATVNELYPQIKGIVLRNGNTLAFYPASVEDYQEILQKGKLTVDERQIKPLKLEPEDVSLRSLLWDKQIVDVDGAKVVRVNDIHCLIGERQWVVHVDVGFTGLLRRLGWEKPAQKLAKTFRRPLSDELISWKFVQPVAHHGGDSEPIRLSVGAQKLAELHPGELADILEDLNSAEQQALVAAMDVETAAEALEETDEEVQKLIFEGMDAERAADIIEEMEPSKAADILENLDEETAEDIIEALEEGEEKEELQELLTYTEDTAGSLMSTDFLEIAHTATIGEAMEAIRKAAGEIEAYYYIYVHDDDGKLIGALSLRSLLQTDANLQVGNEIEGRLVTLLTDANAMEICETFIRYNFLFVPIVDEDGVLKGVISFKHAFDQLLPYFYRVWKAD